MRIILVDCLEKAIAAERQAFSGLQAFKINRTCRRPEKRIHGNTLLLCRFASPVKIPGAALLDN